MACNGMAPSSSSSSPSFFHPSFMLQMQTPHPERVAEAEEEERHHYHQHHHHHHHQLPPAAAGLHELRGMSPLMLGKRSMSFSGAEMNAGCGEEEGSDEEGSLAGEKKRRLNMEQVRTLEKNFELGNKLEPERKIQLARALGMQPRQVAIWFQNRRARWKTKQLEKDFDMLKRQFEAIKSENEALKSRNKQLQSEILAIKGRETSDCINLNKETEGSCSNRSENSSEINLDISRHSAIKSPQQLHSHPHPPPPHHHHHHQPPSFFQSLRPPDMNQLFQSPSSSRPDDQAECPKLENGVPESNFSNLLCSMEDQSAAAFWSWSDHHNFH